MNTFFCNLYHLPGTYSISLTVTNSAGSITVSNQNYLTFAACPNLPVRILGTGNFATLQAAYNAAVSGNNIMSQPQDITGNVTASQAIAVTLDGGYDCTYSTKIDSTGIIGTLTIQNGTVTANDVSVNQ